MAPRSSRQRPTYLLSGLLRCACCSGGMAMISATRLGCSNARNKGEAVCTNRRTAKRSDVEGKMLRALSTQLMAPEVYAAFVRAFTASGTWSRASAPPSRTVSATSRGGSRGRSSTSSRRSRTAAGSRGLCGAEDGGDPGRCRRSSGRLFPRGLWPAGWYGSGSVLVGCGGAQPPSAAELNS